jgi:hypothetical protein
MTGGAEMSARERERARAWLGWPAGSRALLGRTGASERGCGRERTDGPRGWAELEREGGVDPR